MAGQGIDPILGDPDYQEGIAPWLAWGPDLWADGLNLRADGLDWRCSDFASDGTHPSEAGQAKVAARLFEFMISSPYARPWFSSAPVASVPSIGPIGLGALTLGLIGIAGLGRLRPRSGPNRPISKRGP